MKKSAKLTFRMTIATYAVVGAMMVPFIGIIGGGLVPLAMTTYGVVVPGVGTIHA